MRFGIEQMQAQLLLQQVRSIMATSQYRDVVSLDIDVAAVVAQLAKLGFDLIEPNPDLIIFLPHCHNLAAI